MKAQDRSRSFLNGRLKPLLAGLCVGVLCTTLLLLLAALLIRSVDISRTVITPLAIAASGIGAFAAGLTAALVARRNGLVLGAVCGLVLYLIILLTGCAVNSSVDGGYGVIKLAVLTVTGAIGGVLGVNRKKH